jgi:exopolyphosphatase/guanosine-5'-triphosphate,3'-diphosphate pyrophosphatase
VIVSKLAGILRLADAVDYEHGRKVTDVDVDVSNDTVTLKLHGEGDLMLEKWALTRKASLFESVLPAKVNVAT